MYNKLNDLQKCQLDILKETIRVCNKNNIQFCLAFGSCLGAIRHRGFIPWDDDIDIFMPIEDFEKFNQCADKFSQPFFLQNRYTDPEYGLLISRVRNSQTTYIESSEKERDINHGVFIDIYPLFNSPAKKWRGYIQSLNSYIYRLFLYGKPPLHHGSGMKLAGNILLKIFPASVKEWGLKSAYRNMTKYENCGICTGLYAKPFARYRYDWFFPTRNAPFENIVVPIPGKAEKHLKEHYGDYMKLPPESERHIHFYRKMGNVLAHDVEYMDLERSYTAYKGQYYCINKKSIF